jgi:cytochrome c-type biogenesis protein CcmF
MIPELGHFALILAFTLALAQSAFPLLGAWRGDSNWMGVGRTAAVGQLFFVGVAFLALGWAFLQNDFSVAYVAHNSNTHLPWYYRLSAIWGSHEGSLLLWVLILCGWTTAVATLSRELPLVFTARVIGVMGVVSSAFLLFLLATSNPFARLFPSPAQGRDLNPLLQDPGLIAHPPMLYMGYVGFSVAFSFAIAALLGGRLDATWARWSRPWTIMAWTFLTVGIAMGSWWAYYELGWGGWWFWDPVENASFMPWLAGTALIHSLAVTEKRGAFKSWTVLLAIFTFSLSILGTFLVRSGVLTSVHAFATDPRRGVFILALLVGVVGASLALYAWRAPKIRSQGRFELLSRETTLLLNNALLTVAAATVLLGTLYPLFMDALGIGKISVGPPYFDTVFVPLMLPLLVLVGIGSLTRWKRQSASGLLWKLRGAFLATAVAALVAAWWMLSVSAAAVLGLSLAVWVAWTSVQPLWERVRGRSRPLRALRQTPRGFWGMTLAHLGLAFFVAGVTVVQTFELETDLRMAPGESFQASGYTWRFDGVKPVRGANYEASRGTVTVFRDGKLVTELHPEKRTYLAQRRPTTEAGIDGGIFRDLYVSLGEKLDGKGAWSIRVQYKPMVRWIWLGALVMAVGGVLAATDRRYRRLLARERAGAGDSVSPTSESIA